jgi:hypothetical protein
LVYSPAGDRLAAFVGSAVVLLDPAAGRTLWGPTTAFPSSVRGLRAFTPDGAVLVLHNGGAALDAATGRPAGVPDDNPLAWLTTLPHRSERFAMQPLDPYPAVSPCRRWVLVAASNELVEVPTARRVPFAWLVPPAAVDDSPYRALAAHTARAVGPDGTVLIEVGRRLAVYREADLTAATARVRPLDLGPPPPPSPTGFLARLFGPPPSPPPPLVLPERVEVAPVAVLDVPDESAAAFTPDGGTLLTAGADGLARAWDTAGGRPRATLDLGVGPLTAVTVSQDGLRAAAAGTGGVAVWDLD